MHLVLAGFANTFTHLLKITLLFQEIHVRWHYLCSQQSHMCQQTSVNMLLQQPLSSFLCKQIYVQAPLPAGNGIRTKFWFVSIFNKHCFWTLKEDTLLVALPFSSQFIHLFVHSDHVSYIFFYYLLKWDFTKMLKNVDDHWKL